MSETSLSIFSRGSQLLAEANTIQKAKDLKDLALTAADWARRKGMGEEAVQYARSYALDAERKMGQMLIEAPKAKGTQGQPQKGMRGITGGDNREPPVKSPPTLHSLGLTKRDSSQAQKLARLPEDKFQEVKAGTMKLHKVDKPHVSEASGENEWYTPPEYIKAVREVMGRIDCDPASSEKANRTVKADTFFTIDNDGLSKEWHGSVFMNPPYAQPLIGQFSAVIVKKFKAEEIDEACILVNNATETVWFQSMAECSSAVCFPKSRVRFLDPAGNPGAPLQGQAVIYLGKKSEVFCRVFGKFGTTWSR
jgi:ParB family chromosome partitioning protein